MTTQPTQPTASLKRLQELDGGGARIAAHGGLIAVASDDDVTLWRDFARQTTADAPGPIDRVRFADGDRELLAAPHALDLTTRTWTQLPDLAQALANDLDGRPSGQLMVRRADWSADGRELVALAEHVPPRGLRSAGDAASRASTRLLRLDRQRNALATPWTSAHATSGTPPTSVTVGKRFVAAAGTDLRAWDRLTHKPVATLTVHTATVRELAFSPDESLLASASNDHQVVIIDTATWKPVGHWNAHDGDVRSVAFHPPRPLLATTGQDGQVRVWSPSGQRLAEATLGQIGNAVAFTQDGSKLLVATDEHVVVFELYAP